jgi:predicted RNase H-like HicB family nuclease
MTRGSFQDGLAGGAIMSTKTKIEYTVQVWQEGKQFIAHAMPLDVMSCGPTPEHASQALREAVELYLVTAAETGTLTEVLEEVGYEPKGQRWISPTWIALERQSVPVGI